LKGKGSIYVGGLLCLRFEAKGIMEEWNDGMTLLRVVGYLIKFTRRASSYIPLWEITEDR